ncbi:MAG: response regulator RpfG family c-di-GMP phosphodiesterase/ribonuclease BN (tRNA processing enzyme) [Sulfurimonas sp.]|jgi:response regulator RpfG family c-di-GMP phosphodiesterase/ribonuclease BN (tRNA processing enzyme)|uniref:HD domain-containing phosphohydrolase n=1 Tax=Sulfurimonas sp. TaxID=2022749 RepID=UPI0039E2C06F
MKHARSLNPNEILELIFIYLTEVSALRDYDDILAVLANMGRALTSSDRCTVWVVSDDKKTIWTKVAHGIDAIELPIDSGIVGSAIVNEEKIIIKDVYQDKRFNPDIDKKTGYITKSMMVIPMFDNDDEIIGAFQVINHQGEKEAFDDNDMKRLMLASTYAAETLVAVKMTQEIEDTQREVVFTMGAIGESRSKETGNHVKRVAEYSKILALAYGLPKEEAELLKQASPMHDIGKVAIPDAILNKPGRFNAQERAIMDTHAELGYQMTNNSERPLLKAASIVAYEHHEKWNGTGYPQGKSGKDIHIYGRITAIADVFDALGSDRVYKKAWEDEKILKLFKDGRGKHFDPDLIDIFFENIDAIFDVRETFKDVYVEVKEDTEENEKNIKVLGAYGTKAKGFGTSSFYLNEKNVIDAGNLLVGLEEKSAKINNIWLTHSHLDHISDIAYIIDNYFDNLQEPITLCGLPATLEAIQKHFLNDIIWPDFSKIKLLNGNGMCIQYKEIEFDKEYTLSDTESIRPIKTDHTVPSCGYIYRKNETAILMTADTYSIENIVEILNEDESITSALIECSFPSRMKSLAKESKHLTPKLLGERLKSLKRDNISLYINHIKPLYLEEMTQEIEEYCGHLNAKIAKDGEIIKF